MELTVARACRVPVGLRSCQEADRPATAFSGHQPRSTGLSTRLDPEDLREVIAAYHRAVAAVVRGFDGFIAKYMGDGVLAYFGYPQAHGRSGSTIS